MSITCSNLNRLAPRGLLTATLAVTAIAIAPQLAHADTKPTNTAAAKTTKTKTAKTKTAKHTTKFTLKVIDRNGRARTVTLGDRTGRASGLRKNSLLDCVYLPSAVAAFWATRHPYFALIAGVRARGCGDWIANSICWTSRQWWGGGARWIVGAATAWRYNTC